MTRVRTGPLHQGIETVQKLLSGRWARRMLKNFSISVTGSVVLLVTGLIRTALLTKTLPIEDYGKIMIVINMFTMLTAFFNLRVEDVLYRFYPDFREHDDDALSGLIWLCLVISLGLGLALALGAFFSAPWIVQVLYDQDQALLPLIRVYAWSAIVMAVSSFTTALLRLQDRFAQAVIPQITGSIISLALMALYVLTAPALRLEGIVLIFALDLALQSVPPFLMALYSVRDKLRPSRLLPGNQALARQRTSVFSTLFQTNLVGYLKLGSDQGGIFLLGVFAGPTQVALYSIARQLTRPFIIAQNNIAAVIIPEMVSLWGKGQIHRLYKFVRVYSGGILGASAIAAVMLALIIKPLLLLIARPDYLLALPVLYITCLTIVLDISSLPFYTLALCLDQLKRRNLVHAFQLVYLGFAVGVGLNIVNLALVQLAGSLSLRLLNDLPLYRNLRRLTRPV